MILYVGRLDASHKGHDTFLEALALVEASGPPPYSAWLVGGDVNELNTLRGEFRQNPLLNAMNRDGRLRLWGRIAHESLPELYSRASFVVMPSRKETFGLVAIESMACGAPVIAGRVGGLANTVLHQYTGAHFEPGDSESLASLMMTWIRSPVLCKYLGERAREWAEYAYSHASVHGGLHRILRRQEREPVGSHPSEAPQDFRERLARQEISAWIGSPDHIEVISKKHNSVYLVKAGGIDFVVKRLTTQPKTDMSIYRLPIGLRQPGAAERRARSLAGSHRKQTLPVLGQKGLLLKFPLAEPTSNLEPEAGLSTLAHLSHQDEPIEVPKRFLGALDALQRSWAQQDLDIVDFEASALNAHIYGAKDIYVRCHPGVEVIRLLLTLETSWFPVSRSLNEPLKRLVKRALERADEFSSLPVRFQHGDAKSAHFLRYNSELVLCDIETSRLAFGALDLSDFAIDLFREEESSFGARVLEFFHSYGDVSGGASALTWSVAQLLHKALAAWSWGDVCKLEVAKRKIESLLLASSSTTKL